MHSKPHKPSPKPEHEAKLPAVKEPPDVKLPARVWDLDMSPGVHEPPKPSTPPNGWKVVLGGYTRAHGSLVCSVASRMVGDETRFGWRIKGRGFDISNDPAETHETAEAAQAACDKRADSL